MSSHSDPTESRRQANKPINSKTIMIVVEWEGGAERKGDRYNLYDTPELCP